MSESKRVRLLALPFSTEEVFNFKEMEAKNSDSLSLTIPDWLSTGPLVEEIARPMVKAFEGDGVIIADHQKKTSSEIVATINILEKFDKRVYSITNGLTPLTAEKLVSL